MKISEGEVAGLQCPGFGCTKLVPIDVVASIVPREVDAKYLKFGIDAFVSASTNLQWCPHPGCGRAVCLPGSDTASGSDMTDGGGSQTSGDSEVVPRAVDCGMGHFFCWACGNEAHDPCDCELWVRWKDEVSKHDDSQLISSASEASHQASSAAWISQHSKPCPNCKAPIERSDGCNHMTCSKCEHDFCWVCLGNWSVHGSRTGGYFHCNRYRTAKNVKQQLEKTREKASAEAKKRSTKFFKHMLSRYMNHTESLKYEEGLLGLAKEKAAALIGAVQGSSAVPISEIDGGFVEDAVRELLKARSALRSTYAMSYYINSDSVRDQVIKAVARLEKSTEILAEMIARPHLRTPKDRIVLATVESREIRRKFLPEARKLNPPKAVETAELEDEELDPVDMNSIFYDSDYTDTDTDWDDDDDTDSTSS